MWQTLFPRSLFLTLSLFLFSHFPFFKARQKASSHGQGERDVFSLWGWRVSWGSSSLQWRLHSPLLSAKLRRPCTRWWLCPVEGRPFWPTARPSAPALQAGFPFRQASHILLHTWRRLLHWVPHMAQLPKLLFPPCVWASSGCYLTWLSTRSWESATCCHRGWVQGCEVAPSSSFGWEPWYLVNRGSRFWASFHFWRLGRR